MAEAFSYFTYNNNLERSFLSSLSQILQENNDEQQVELVEDSSQLELVKDDVEGPTGEDHLSFLQNQDEKENDHESLASSTGSESGASAKSGSSSASRTSVKSGSSSASRKSSKSKESSDDENTDFYVQLLSTKFQQPAKKKNKSAKVVPLPTPSTRGKRVQFTPTSTHGDHKSGVKESKEVTSSDEEDDDVKEVDISARGRVEGESSDNENELEALVKQLVLLENEASKAQQFLTFIQQHSCFDKQDQKSVLQFMELIEQEKNSLVLVLSNFSPHVQPLITMMTIAERRLTLLDSTQFITAGSTLHETFLEKQRMLQDVIEQAAAHVYGKRY